MACQLLKLNFHIRDEAPRRSARLQREGMQQFSSPAGNSSPEVTEPLPRSAESLALETNGSRPHVLFLIDHLMARGGGEGNLLKIVELMPSQLVRCSVATFRIHPEIRKSVSVPVHVFPLRRTYNLGAIKAAWQLRRLIRREKIDIVQTYFETSDLWGGLVAKLSGAVFLSSRRDLGILRSAKHRLAYRFLNRITDRVLAVSEEVRRFCIATDRVDPGKISVVYNGVDFSQVAAASPQASPYASAEWAKAGHIVTCVANIRRIKGIDVLVRAAQRVCAEIPGAVFLLVGDCSPRPSVEEIRSLVRSLGLENNVKFLNFVENPVPILKMSNVFCLLSRSEGFSNALLEAMACGVPPVVTQVGGNPEAIRDGENGFLVPPEDDKAAAERILSLLRDPERARRLGEAARATARTQFSAETMIQNLVGLYRELLETRK